MKMNISKRGGIYIEDRHKIKKVRLDDRDYPKAIGAMIGVCADAIIIDPEKKIFYLPRRVVKPMMGYWSIGGRRFPGDSAAASVAKNFMRETGVKAPRGRFRFISTIEVIWKDRKESPVNIGKHDIIQFFSIKLDKKELAHASANLCRTEYAAGSLEAFDRKKMASKRLHPALIDLYDKIFPRRR
jgi:ADP-ribose pyrophosphatase YjhB (NUDIX family)